MNALAEQWEIEAQDDARVEECGDDVFCVCVEAEKASQYLYVIGQIEAEIEEMGTIANDQIVAISKWEEVERNKRQRRIDWLAQALEGWMRTRDANVKTVKLPSGVLKLRAQQAKLVIDEEVFFQEAPPERWIRLIEPSLAWRAPDKKALRADIPAMLKKTSEIPAGVTWEEQDPKFSYGV